MKPNSLKKLFTVILTTLFLVGFNLTPAQAVTIVSCSNGGSFSYTGTTVDSISGQSCIGTAVIPNTITIISQSAFADATGLMAVTIGTSVIRIDDFAFRNTRLSTVTIPNNVQTLGNGVFQSNPLLYTVTIGTGLTAMGALTFEGSLGGLPRVTFEGNAPTVGAQSFDGASSTALAVIKFTATGFGADGSDWNGLEVTRNRGVISCGTSGTFTIASYNVTGNTSCVGTVNIPSGVLTISPRAFKDNTDITSVTIPDSVTSIGERAFQSANGLTTLTIGNSVTTIGDRAFENTFRLTALIIPDSVVTIGSIAFSFAPLTSLTLGNQLTTIDSRAFYRNGLSSVTLPASLTTLGTMVFEDGPIVEVNFLGNAPQNVDSLAFYGIGTGAKANVAYNATGFPTNGSTWNSLTIQRIANCSTSGYFTIVNNVVTGNTSCVGTVNIPSGVTSIGEDAFLGTTSITSVTIPNTVTSIGINAFRNATSLTDVTIPDSVITISNGAFRNTRFSSVTLGNSVTTIGVRAFGDSRLTSVTIPNSVSTIDSFAFQSITTLASVTFLGNAPATVQANAFDGVPTGTPANVAYNATGFPTNGSTWNGLIISYGSAPAGDSDSTTATVITPKVLKTADVVFNLKNKKYLSKNALKTKLSKNKSFKRVPEDLYKYSIFNASKKTCVVNENYVTGLKKTGTCDLYATRTTTKGVKYKYWVQINYTK